MWLMWTHVTGFKKSDPKIQFFTLKWVYPKKWYNPQKIELETINLSKDT